MDFGETHRPLKRVNIEPLLAAIVRLGPEVWDSDEGLRKTLAPRRATQSIYLHFLDMGDPPTNRRLSQDEIPKRACWPLLGPVVQPLIEELIALYPTGGLVVRSQIAKLEPGGRIPRHWDISPILRMSHRIHVPLITSPQVQFIIDGQPYPCEAGMAFELNNQKFHEVWNGGAEDRLHLVFDLLPGDYEPARLAAAMQTPARPPG